MTKETIMITLILVTITILLIYATIRELKEYIEVKEHTSFYMWYEIKLSFLILLDFLFITLFIIPYIVFVIY